MLPPVPIAIGDANVRQWLNQARDAIDVSPQVVGTFTTDSHTATLVNAIIPNTAPTRAEGVYRVSVSSRVKRVASTSSSLRTTVSWITRGVTVTMLSAGISGNILTEADSLVCLIRADVGTAITITVTRTSVGLQPMLFDADGRIEAMPEALG